jgi:hypothetical protein
MLGNERNGGRGLKAVSIDSYSLRELSQFFFSIVDIVTKGNVFKILFVTELFCLFCREERNLTTSKDRLN